MRSLILGLALLLSLPLCAKDEARRLYEAGQYNDALKLYDQILAKHPDWEEAHFGKGAALYKAGQTMEAMREFEQAIPSKDPQQKAAAFYNMGNAFLTSQKLQESMQFYKQAIRLNPRDFDAKHNYELARQLLQQQQNQPQNQQNQDQQNQDQQNQDQKQSQQPQNQQDQNQQNQDQKQSQQDQQKQNQQQPQDQPPREKRAEEQKSREEAAQILDALKDNEKKMMQERMKTKYSGIKKEKDW